MSVLKNMSAYGWSAFGGKNKVLFLIILLALIFTVSGCMHKQTECSDELKICPSGAEVKRNAKNNCEFFPCPEELGLIVNEEENKDDQTETVSEDGQVKDDTDSIDSLESNYGASDEMNDEDDDVIESEVDELTEEQDKEIPDMNSVITESDKIKVFDIKAGDTLASPLKIIGEGEALENELFIELRNKDYIALVQETANIQSSKTGDLGSFKITLEFSFQSTKEGYLAVYGKNLDGSPENLIEIPVKFKVIE